MSNINVNWLADNQACHSGWTSGVQYRLGANFSTANWQLPRRAPAVCYMDTTTSHGSLKSHPHRNTVCAIHRLPNELLVCIFQEVAADVRDPANFLLPENAEDIQHWTETAISRVDTRPLIMLTSVCKQWRSVLLALPSMWTYLDAHHVDEFNTFLGRSSTLSLSLRVDLEGIYVPPPPGNEFTRKSNPGNVYHGNEGSQMTVRGNMDGEDDDWNTRESEGEDNDNGKIADQSEDNTHPERVRTLKQGGVREKMVLNAIQKCGARLRRLDIVVRSHVIDIPAWLTVAAPHIECVTIHLPLPREEIEGVPDSRPIFPDSRPSLLKALAVSQATSWIPGNDFPFLTHLYLSLAVYVTIDVILGFLRRTPNLSYLHLSTYVDPDYEPRSRQVVALNNLRSLVFSKCNFPALDILLFLSLSPGGVLIRCDDIVFSEAEPGNFTLSGSTAISSFTRLDIQLFNDDIHILAEGPTSGFWLQGVQDQDAFAPPFHWQTFITELPRRIPVASLASLRATLHDGIEPDVITEFLKHTPQLTELALSVSVPISDYDHNPFLYETVTHSYLYSLCNDLSETNPTLCPQLRAVTVRLDCLADDDFVAFKNKLQGMLVARRAAGCPLRELVVKPRSVETAAGWQLTLPASPRAESPVRAAFRGLEGLVETLRVVEPSEPLPDEALPPQMHAMWAEAAEGEQRYWTLSPGRRPHGCAQETAR